LRRHARCPIYVFCVAIFYVACFGPTCGRGDVIKQVRDFELKPRLFLDQPRIQMPGTRHTAPGGFGGGGGGGSKTNGGGAAAAAGAAKGTAEASYELM
jgi:hypothetical protein